MSRFDYVAYDQVASSAQGFAKTVCTDLEEVIMTLPDGRAKSLALTHLEECYTWIGKAIRDDQIARNGTAPLQEGRTDS